MNNPRWSSGASKRKAKKEKENREAAFRKNVPAIFNFFTTPTNANNNEADDINTPVEESNSMSNIPGATTSCSTHSEKDESNSLPSPCHPNPLPMTNGSEIMSQIQNPLKEGNQQQQVPQEEQRNRIENSGSDQYSWCERVTDPALWKNTCSDIVISILVERGAGPFQNRSLKYPASARDRVLGGKYRCFTNELLTCNLPNGQNVSRQWLLYSPSTGNVYCFACKLFSTKKHHFTEGFSDWKHSERIVEHERSAEHRTCLLILHKRSKAKATIDSDLVKQMDGEKHYWREVLRRVVAVIKFLGERGLALRGEDELLGSSHNGNFLGILELLSQFDPFLAEHIKKYGQKGKGSVSYLSSTTCEELIDIMGEKTKRAIADELREAKYYSIIVDSTPDLSHVDQLTFIFRFVNKEGNVVERFLAFEPIHSHTGESLSQCVIGMLDSLGLDLSNCRGQAYDNASNMSGKYHGLQAYLKRENPLIHYVPCAAHSLNLVGVNTIDCSSPEAGYFFDLLQSLYTFCSSSTHRWGRIFRKTDITLKSLSTTRWSARADASRALSRNYVHIRDAMSDISADVSEKRDTRSQACALVAKLDTLEIAFMAHFWDTILERFQSTSSQLQKSDINIFTAVRLLESLLEFVATQKDKFESFERAALNISFVSRSYKYDLQRSRKRKTFSDDTEPVGILDGRSKFRIETFNVVIDKLLSCLEHRLDAYKQLTDLFGVLYMCEQSNSDIISKATALCAAYPSDLDISLGSELIHFRSFMCDQQSPTKMLQTLMDLDLRSAFPNVYVVIRIFLTLPVTNCEGERSFSHLARIKNELRTRMRQECLCSLSLMAIESELVKELDFNDVVENFARTKVRKRIL